MKAAIKKRLELLEHLSKSKTGNVITVGFVGSDGLADREADAYFPEKLRPLFERPKRFNVLIGGRGSGKSAGVGGYVSIDMHDKHQSWLCLREYQNSIRDSVHGLIKGEVERLEIDGFSVTENTIKCSTAEARFGGLARNPDSVKSAFGFGGFWVEEAQTTSANSLKILTPTARNKPKRGLPGQLIDVEDGADLDQVRMIFCANPGSSEDPFSQRFIVPFKQQLDKDGIYEDDLHLIIVMNWRDNPWFADSGLENERQFDYDNLPRALYNHIWEGEFNDSIDNALVMSEWFDACIDAHKRVGNESQWKAGAKFAAHDPSDTGPDDKGYACRHGSVVTRLGLMDSGNINEGGDWATGQAIQDQVDYYTWDCDGMGVGLDRQTQAAFKDKRISIAMFKGSEAPDAPTAIYSGRITNKDAFRNKRAQYYQKLRDRIYNTYQAVIHGKFCPVEDMISFDSSSPLINKLRSELCRMPIKPNANGYIEMYTKEEMKRKFNLPSPNCGDSVMMLMRVQQNPNSSQNIVMPNAIKPMGRR